MIAIIWRPQNQPGNWYLVVCCLHSYGGSPGPRTPWRERERSRHARHHVGHQPFMKASLLGTLSSRHLLCPSLHRSGDPKTAFFFFFLCFSPGSSYPYVTAPKWDVDSLTSIQEVVDALVLPQGREVQVVDQRVQAVLDGEGRGGEEGVNMRGRPHKAAVCESCCCCCCCFKPGLH